MTERWATAVVHVQPVDAADATRRLLVRAHVRIGDAPRQLIGPVLVGREEAGNLLEGILDRIYGALSSLSNATDPPGGEPGGERWGRAQVSGPQAGDAGV
jgi:hypothetical protein